jgi:hypothetical protein
MGIFGGLGGLCLFIVYMLNVSLCIVSLRLFVGVYVLGYVVVY